MAATAIPLDTWPRRETLALFRRFQKPQYAVTARVDVTKILIRRADDETFSSYLACVHAIGVALHAVCQFAQQQLYLVCNGGAHGGFIAPYQLGR